MSFNFLKDGAKRSIQSRFSIKDYSFTTIQPLPVLTKQGSRGYYTRFPFLFKKLKDSAISSPPSFFSSSLSFSSTSSSYASSGFIGWYLSMIKAHPVLTKSITAASIYTAADLTSQGITLTALESYDLPRTLRMGGYGLLVAGPTMHFWFNFIERVMPKRDMLTTFKKILAGQAVYGPVMTVVFFSLNAALQGENGYEIIARLKRDLVPTLRNGLMYWPMCDFVTFKFLPVHLQPLMSNSFSYLWTIYITYMASLKKVDPSTVSVGVARSDAKLENTTQRATNPAGLKL